MSPNFTLLSPREGFSNGATASKEGGVGRSLTATLLDENAALGKQNFFGGRHGESPLKALLLGLAKAATGAGTGKNFPAIREEGEVATSAVEGPLRAAAAAFLRATKAVLGAGTPSKGIATGVTAAIALAAEGMPDISEVPGVAYEAKGLPSLADSI